ncbi:MAG: GH3 auxin-responsive promoter family protein [Cyanobacteria bacterium P01_F01_bin.42]
MKQAIVSVATHILRRGKASFLKKARNPQQYQTRFLLDLIKRHRDTEFGRTHGFDQISTIAEFQQRVPIRTYQDFEPFIVRMTEGEENVLIRERPIYFNITSGSTGKRKFIPVTKSSRKCIKKAASVTTGFLADAALRKGLPLGTLLFPASMNSVGSTKGGIDFAPVSTSDLKLSNIGYRAFLSSPIESHQIPDLKSRHYVCLAFALCDPTLRVIADTFPVTTLRLCQFLALHSESLVHDLETRTLTDWLKISPDQRQVLEGKLKARPARIADLKKVLAEHGRLTPEYAWPSLSFVVTARGGTSDFYFERFPEYFGTTPIFGGVYSSAEATFGTHRDFGTDGVLLALESGFFEFIPRSQWDLEQPQTVLPWELEVGQQYRILVTNYNGFYRYDVGDVIEVEGFEGQTPIFIFRHRYKGFITSVGEKTTEHHVTQVMSQLQKKHQVALENFCVTLTDEIPPCYVVNIELPEGKAIADPMQFIDDYDRFLADFHNIYGLKRKDQVKPPILRILQSGSFEQLQQSLIQKGASEVQIKLPKISYDRHLFPESAVIEEYQSQQTLKMQL